MLAGGARGNWRTHPQAHPAPMADRRRRIHELVLALIAQQSDLELLDGDATSPQRDPASWLERNRRLLQRYQAVVRTAVTLDALIDQEAGGIDASQRRV